MTPDRSVLELSDSPQDKMTPFVRYEIDILHLDSAKIVHV